MEARRRYGVRGVHDLAGTMQGVHCGLVRSERIRGMRGHMVLFTGHERGSERQRMAAGYTVGVLGLRGPLLGRVVVPKEQIE